MESFDYGRPALESYSAIINGHARLGNLDSAAKWFGDMERNGLTATWCVRILDVFGLI